MPATAIALRTFVTFTLALSCVDAGQAAQLVISGPAGSAQFGRQAIVLPNGNIVVTDPGWNGNVGAVRLYGPGGELLTTLTGSQAGDQVGTSANLVGDDVVVRSPYWRNGSAQFAGAITFIDGSTGLEGVVSPANSMVGSGQFNQVGDGRLRVLANGKFVVASIFWEPATGGPQDVGAVTLFDPATGTHGVVSAANSLVGSSASDLVGFAEIVPLVNGNYVVVSPRWDGPASDAGAVTWGSGATGVVGTVSAANSMVGVAANNQIGTNTNVSTVFALPNGDYVVASANWSNGPTFAAGSVRIGNGTTGSVGVITAANALVGTGPSNNVGNFVIVAPNSTFVVLSPGWDSAAALDVGAATWMRASAPLVGALSASNSLVGTTQGDAVGQQGIVLANGNFVVGSPNRDQGSFVDAGSATWISGATGLTGPVSASNSMWAAQQNCRFGQLTALTNGNYLVSAPYCGDGTNDQVGLVHWVDGSASSSFAVTAANSMSGSSAGDLVGAFVHALPNGNYVVASPYINLPGAPGAGATTWGNGSIGTNSLVGAAAIAASSIVGATAGDNVNVIETLADGNYLVGGPFVDGAAENTGAASWVAGNGPASGSIATRPALVGTTAEDRIGNFRWYAFSDGSYALHGDSWNDGPTLQVGAVTLGRGVVDAAVSASNSVIGTVPTSANQWWVDYYAPRRQLVVGQPAANRVVIQGEMLLKDGFE